MLENIKAVNNPLTIIAIFAALAEIASTVAVVYVRPELQYIFIWFVIGFPALLVILFFLTLNFNHKVLYAPSDFKDEQNFLEMLKDQKTVQNLEEIQKAVESAKIEIESKLKGVDETITAQISQAIDKNLEQVNKKIESTKDELEFVKIIDSAVDLIKYNNNSDSLMKYINSQKGYVTNRDIFRNFPYLTRQRTSQILSSLVDKNFIKKELINDEVCYGPVFIDNDS